MLTLRHVYKLMFLVLALSTTGAFIWWFYSADLIEGRWKGRGLGVVFDILLVEKQGSLTGAGGMILSRAGKVTAVPVRVVGYRTKGSAAMTFSLNEGATTSVVLKIQSREGMKGVLYGRDGSVVPITFVRGE